MIIVDIVTKRVNYDNWPRHHENIPVKNFIGLKPQLFNPVYLSPFTVDKRIQVISNKMLFKTVIPQRKENKAFIKYFFLINAHGDVYPLFN